MHNEIKEIIKRIKAEDDFIIIIPLGKVEGKGFAEKKLQNESGGNKDGKRKNFI